MQFTWHLFAIIITILFGLYFFQMSRKSIDMSEEQVQLSNMYLHWAYISWAIAVALVLYYYFILGEKIFKANMPGPGCGCGGGRATMCSGMPRY